MLYKLVVKVIANRLKQILPSIIAETQSAFVPRQQISNNVFIAYEILHFLRRKKKGKQNYMSLKLNISKVYDRVECNYLRRLMATIGLKNKHD